MTIESCVAEAQQGGVLILRDGLPAALAPGVQGMDQEQVELGLSDRFWQLIGRRRRESTISRAELKKNG